VASRAHWNLRAWIGAAIAVAGLVLWMTARRQLGSSFSLRPQARKLITTGLYEKFRHPIYFFGLIAYSGVLLAWGSWIAALCFLLIYFVEVVRLRKEERLLAMTFGEEYQRYRARTWF
jgi:protein-S-isoprenylcysteine O-methyltransferase Ste14